MVTATEWLKKAEAKRSKNPSKFKAERRRAWDYIESPKITESAESFESTKENEPVIWVQNKEQTGNVNGNNIGSSWEPNKNEIGNNREQNREQSEIKSGNKYENDQQVKISNQSINYPHEVLSEDTLQKRILTLTGHQKHVMRHITSHIKSRAGTPYVVDILPIILAGKIKANLAVTRVTLKRLVSKNLLIRLPGEKGRNGCCKFKIHENIVKICFSLFNDTPCDINQIGNEIGNNDGNVNTYSSSKYINTTTSSLPEEWKKIDFESLQHIGFSEMQLRQLFDSKQADPVVVQDSIYKFAYALQFNQKVKDHPAPLNLLMGVLRKGHNWSEPNYVSAKDLALREVLESKRREREQRDAMIKECVELEFPEWRKKLTDEQVNEIVPVEVKKTGLTAAIQSVLKTYFIENILLPKLKF